MFATSFIKKYRLSIEEKKEIATNLIESLVNNRVPTEETALFIDLWLTAGSRHKNKFTDVWDIVLDGFKPTNTPQLYRACNKLDRICEGKIASYTGRFETACKPKRDKFVILDTKEALKGNSGYDPALFSFFPLYQVLKKHNLCTYWIPEEEYIVRETYCGVRIFNQSYPRTKRFPSP